VFPRRNHRSLAKARAPDTNPAIRIVTMSVSSSQTDSSPSCSSSLLGFERRGRAFFQALTRAGSLRPEPGGLPSGRSKGTTSSGGTLEAL